MRIRYTAAKASMEGAYILYEPWGGEDVHWENAGEVQAVPWSVGGTTNAHAVDIWAGARSSVTNTGILSATAAADADLATARSSQAHQARTQQECYSAADPRPSPTRAASKPRRVREKQLR